MAGWDFWAVALTLAVGAVLVLLTAVLRAANDRTTATGPADLAVYKDQLAEIARDLQRGTLTVDEAERLRAEIGRRVLEADRSQSAIDLTVKDPPSSIRVASILILMLVPFALLVYGGSASILRGIGLQEDSISALKERFSFDLSFRGIDLPKLSLVFDGLGAPGYSDMALGPRLTALDQGIASRPTQETELQALGRPRDAALDARLASDLAAISDPTQLRDRLRRHLEAGEVQAAVRTGERLIAVLGDATDAADHANLALALVIEAEGYVSPEAETQLRDALTRDMSNELSRYLVGELFLQGGRYDKAFTFWRPIAEDGDPAWPWVASVRERIVEVAGLAGVRYALPETGSGPSASDMAAAAEMTPEDRQAMIEGMVAQLSDRLASEGGPVEDWDRLIRSLVVLNRQDEAQKIYDEAKTRFAGREAELATLKQGAVDSGLAP